MGHLTIVRELVAAGASVDQAAEEDGGTPLIMAAQDGHLEVVHALVEAGASRQPGERQCGHAAHQGASVDQDGPITQNVDEDDNGSILALDLKLSMEYKWIHEDEA